MTYAGPSRPLQQCPLPHCPIVHSSRRWEPQQPEWSHHKRDHWHKRAREEWERNLCENKAVAILERMQAGRPALIKKDGGEMLIAIVLDRPLAEAKALVEPPMPSSKPSLESCQDKQNHPVIAQMINPEADDDPTPLERAASSSGGHSHRGLSRIQHRQQRYSAPHHRCYWSTWVLVG